MIQITRNLARQVRSVFRRALGITSHRLTHPLTFQAGPEGLTILARSPNAIRIESPKAAASKAPLPIPKPKIERKLQPVSESLSSQNGNDHAEANGHTPTNGHATSANGKARRTASKADSRTWPA